MSQTKIKLGIFVPLGACDCVYSQFLDKVMKLITPHTDVIDFEVKDACSREGDKLNIYTNSVVVYSSKQFETTKIYKSIPEFERFLETEFPS
jgi:hypothetical protein